MPAPTDPLSPATAALADLGLGKVLTDQVQEQDQARRKKMMALGQSQMSLAAQQLLNIGGMK